ncbi:hypothetical protein NN6n1_36510 [Shinella zoogloeoides]
MAALESFRRSELERRIEEMIALLDLLDEDPDIEDSHDDEPTLGAENDHESSSQEFWAQSSELDECEAEDEHGGDILDEPHDGEGDDEPALGWSGDGRGWIDGNDPRCLEDDRADMSLAGLDDGFDGSGTRIAMELLLRAKPRREPYSEIVGTRHHLLQDGSVFTTLVPR